MKRLLLMFAAVIGLITAGGALAGTPLGSSNSGALRTAVAPAQTTPPARAHARRATGSVAHRHVTIRRPAQGGHVARRAGAERRVGRSLKAVTVAVGKTLRPAAAPGGYLLLDPPAAAPGAAVSVHGGGFAPGALLHLSVRAPGRPALPAADAMAGPDGSFRATITVPLT